MVIGEKFVVQKGAFDALFIRCGVYATIWSAEDLRAVVDMAVKCQKDRKPNAPGAVYVSIPAIGPPIPNLTSVFSQDYSAYGPPNMIQNTPMNPRNTKFKFWAYRPIDGRCTRSTLQNCRRRWLGSTRWCGETQPRRRAGSLTLQNPRVPRTRTTDSRRVRASILRSRDRRLSCARAFRLVVWWPRGARPSRRAFVRSTPQTQRPDLRV